MARTNIFELLRLVLSQDELVFLTHTLIVFGTQLLSPGLQLRPFLKKQKKTTTPKKNTSPQNN